MLEIARQFCLIDIQRLALDNRVEFEITLASGFLIGNSSLLDAFDFFLFGFLPCAPRPLQVRYLGLAAGCAFSLLLLVRGVSRRLLASPRRGAGAFALRLLA